MDGARQALLAGSRFAGDQHRRIVARKTARGREERDHSRALSHEPTEPRRTLHLLRQQAAVLARFGGIADVPQHDVEAVEVDGLEEEVVRALRERRVPALGIVDDRDHLDVIVERAHAADDTGLVAQDVRSDDDEVDGPSMQDGETTRRVLRFPNLGLTTREELAQRRTRRTVSADDQHSDLFHMGVLRGCHHRKFSFPLIVQKGSPCARGGRKFLASPERVTEIGEGARELRVLEAKSARERRRIRYDALAGEEQRRHLAER